MKKRIRDYKITIGRIKTGKNNLITDVEGVKVGHVTLKNKDVNTGVTAIIPSEGNIFKEKLVSCSHVVNGFGKTIGTVQIEEMGTLETPILLTNTLNVGLVSDALIEYMLLQNEDIGISTGTINPVVCECNDGYLNSIRKRSITKNHVFKSIENADVLFEEGAVGAGTGMICYGFKGGIGSASRVIELNGKEYTLGALVLTNFGRQEDFILDGRKFGDEICHLKGGCDKGSCIMILATDIPLSYRQLKRVCKRATVGMARTGSFIGNGSGEIVIGFSTANKIKHYEVEDVIDFKMINEDKIDLIFRAAAESVEESVLDSLVCSETLEGRDGHIMHSLREFLDEI